MVNHGWLEKDFNANEKLLFLGGIAEPKHIHTLADMVTTVILHTDHCAKNFTGLTD
jgi:hypothetical protein